MKLTDTGKNYTVCINTVEHHGFFEHNIKGEDASGGLWFDNEKRLIDYDGMFMVPNSVVTSIRKLGYIVPLEYTQR